MATSFQKSCYEILRKVPKGKVTTYQELAKALNSKAYRAVGTAMNKNPFAPKVPCHRVINSNGKIGNYALGKEKKIQLLKEEGIEIENEKVNLKKYLFRF
jgi:methylated-DNA-[protein]-cysteine S-methyltransferase